MKHLIVLQILVIIFCVPGFAFKSNKKGLSWAHKVNDRPDGDSSVSKVDMILEGRNKKQRKRSMYMYGLETKKKTYNLIRFTHPADIKELGLLTVDTKDKDSNQWLYLPELAKTKKISSNGKGGRFAGSDIYYEDLSVREVNEDHHRFIKKTNYKGQQVIVIESRPKDKKSSIYKKRVAWIHPDTLLPIKMEMYMKNLKKPDKRSEVIDIQKIDGFWTVMESVITDLKRSHKTFLKISNMKYNVKIKTDLFTKQTLLDPKRENKLRKF